MAGRTEINWRHKPKQMSFLKISCMVSTSRKEISWCNKARLRGASTSRARLQVWAQLPGAGPRAWGPKPQAGPRPWAHRALVLDPKLSHLRPVFVVLKSLLVGGWRRGRKLQEINRCKKCQDHHAGQPVGSTWLCYILVAIDY